MLKLNYLMEDDWSRPVYVDQHGRWWLDINLGEGCIDLYKASRNDDMGEPDYPIKEPYEIIKPAPSKHQQFDYMMLSRRKFDCDAHLQTGTPYSSKIPEADRQDIIDEMKALWNKLDIKPEWLSWEEILEYERRVVGPVAGQFIAPDGEVVATAERVAIHEVKPPVRGKVVYNVEDTE